MLMRQCLEIFELLDQPDASGAAVCRLFHSRGAAAETRTVTAADGGKTDFVRISIPGKARERVKTINITGRLGGLGARPALWGFVSDGDGALCALTAALKLADMVAAGERLDGNVQVTTHICPNAPVVPHDPVPLMGSAIETNEINRLEMEHPADAVLSLDTTKGNRILNRRGFAITPTVKQGYILRVSESLLDVASRVSGELPAVLPITTQDITPYGNGLYHMNSIMQPAVATAAPVVGVAITAQTAVPGCATGATQPADVELAARFAVEVAKDFLVGRCRFYDEDEYEKIQALYGSMRHLQTGGNQDGE